MAEVKVNDEVVYARQDRVSSVDEFQARVIAINEDGSVDLQVLGYYGTSHIAKGVRFDETGKPSSFHLMPPGWQPTNVRGGINTQSGFGSEDVGMIGVIKT